MIPRIWIASLIIEAALSVTVTVKGGFPAFRRFLWWSCLSGVACVAAALWGHYALIDAISEAGEAILLMFVVGEVLEDTADRDLSTYALVAAVVSIPVHLWFVRHATPTFLTLLLAAVALAHSLMGVMLLVAMVDSRRLTAHRCILAGWLVGTAALFYAAPLYPVGYALCWLNSGAYLAWGILACRQENSR